MLKCKDCKLCLKEYWEYDITWDCQWSEKFLGVMDREGAVGSKNNLDEEQECSLNVDELQQIVDLYQGVIDAKKAQNSN